MAMHFVAIAVTRNLSVKNSSSHLKGVMDEWAQNMMPIEAKYEAKYLNKISLLGSI